MDDHIISDIDPDESFVCDQCVDDCFPPIDPQAHWRLEKGGRKTPPPCMATSSSSVHGPNIPTNDGLDKKRKAKKSFGGCCCFPNCTVGDDDDDDASLEECVCGKVGHPCCLEVFLGHENVDKFCCHECVEFVHPNANLNKHDKKQQGKKLKKSTLDDEGDTESDEDDKYSHLNWDDNNGPRNTRANNGGGYNGNINAAYDNGFNGQGGSSAEEDDGDITEINKEMAHLEEDEMAAQKKEESEREARLCTILSGPALSKKGISAADKRTYAKALFGYVSIKFVLTGQRLTKGKATYDLMARMVKETGFSSKTIAAFASPLLQIGRLIHAEGCQNEDCNICNGDYDSDAGMVELDEVEAAGRVARLFELSYGILLDKESSESDCARAAGPPKKKKVSKDLFKPDNCPPGLRSRPSMTDVHPCPICGTGDHRGSVTRIHTKAFLEESRAHAERDRETRLAGENRKPSSQRKKIRMGKIPVQEYYCLCFQKQNSNCMCCVGPFKDSEREKLSAQYQDYRNGIEEEDTAATLSTNVGTFVANVIGGALALGESDARQAGLKLNPDNVQAMSTDHMNDVLISDNDKHAISESMGQPTDILPDGNGISHYQTLERGHRYYNGGLSKTGGIGRGRGKQPTNHSLPPSGRGSATGGSRTKRNSNSSTHDDSLAAMMSGEPQGVSVDRTKKQLRSKVMKGTPNTQKAAVSVLDNIAKGERNASTETVYDAERDKEANSQDIANMAIQCKKLSD